MKKNIYIVIASILMILTGILRGSGGVLLILKGNTVPVEPPIIASNLISKLCGIGLIIVCFLFVYSAYLLLNRKYIKGFKLSWIAIGLFLIGGIVNGYLLFKNPFVQDQIINFSASILIGILLLIGKNNLNKTTANKVLPKAGLNSFD